MKKVLLSAMSLGMALCASAQGISDVGAFDDFAKKTEYSVETSAGSGVYKGIYWWKAEEGGLEFTTTRSGNGVLVVDIKQPAKAYEPIGVGFGEDAEGEPFTLDLSGDAVVSFTFKNISETPVEFKVALQDVNGVTLGFADNLEVAGGVPTTNLYMYEIGATSTDGIGVDGINFVGVEGNSNDDPSVVNFSYDFKNALAAEYVFNPNDPYECNNLPQWVEGCENGTCFDYSKVKALTITVVNHDGGEYNNVAECWSKDAFNGKFELSNVIIGKKVVGLFGAKASASNVNVYPNPASDFVTFGKKLTNVSVYNAHGQLVDTFSTSEGLNVSAYAEGVYFINAAEGSARILVK